MSKVYNPMIQVSTEIGSATWASYIINGDATGIDDDDRALADAWLEKVSADGGEVVDCGRTECDRCNGSGKVDCNDPDCDDGTDAEGEPCITCDGVGRIECSDCGGEGWMDEEPWFSWLAGLHTGGQEAGGECLRYTVLHYGPFAPEV